MVKPDVTRNYYADLELPTNASIEDVRRAYRKLALQYHPDRNSGREEECVPRFQAIQAANEVLSDATSKAKYDTDRRKAALYPTSSHAGAQQTYKPSDNTPGNPYAARSDFPPPPRRTQPGTYQRPTSTPSGADRFAHFPRAAGAGSRKDPAADRAQQFKAWQSMNNPPRQTQTPPQVPPRAPQQPPPASGWKQNPNRMRPQPAPRAETQMPTEDQIRAGMRHTNSFKSSTPGEDDAAASRQTAWQAFQDANAAQQGMPRANKASRRVPTTPKRPGGFDPNAPGSDERAAPPSSHYVHRHKSEDFGRDGYPPPPPGPPPSTTAPDSPVSPNSRAVPDPLRPFRSRNSNDMDTPYTEANRTSTPYGQFLGERTDVSSEGIRRSASTRDTTKLSPESANHHSRARSVDRFSGQRPAEPQVSSQNSLPKPTFTAGSNSFSGSDISTDTDDDSTRTPEEFDATKPKTAASNVKDRPIKKPTPPSRRYNGSANPFPPPPGPPSNDDTHTNSAHPSTKEGKQSANIFTLPVDSNNNTYRPTPPKSRSVESINTNFSPGGWNGTFQGAGDYFAPNGPDRRPSPARRNGSNRGGHRANTIDSTPTSRTASPNLRPSFNNQYGSSTHSSSNENNFDANSWAETLRDASWASAASNAHSKKPTRTASIERPDGVEKQSFIVDEPEETVSSNSVPSMASREADDAMDIDTPPRPAETAEQTPARDGKEPRLYSVHPSAWRQRQEALLDHHRKASANPPQPTREPEELKTTLDDLRFTEPFIAGANGLHNLADISSTLPFESKASSTAPTHDTYQPFRMPKVPKAPDAPPKFTKATWREYAQKFATYLYAFHLFNREMLEHFDAHQKQAEARLSCGMDWLGATGDPVKGPMGFGNYLRTVMEDEQVRETWNLGCERHLEAVSTFDSMRDRVKGMAASGTLAE